MTHTVGRPPHVLIGGVDPSGYRQPGAFTPRADRRFCIQLDFVIVGRLPRVLIGGFAPKSNWMQNLHIVIVGRLPRVLIGGFAPKSNWMQNLHVSWQAITGGNLGNS